VADFLHNIDVCAFVIGPDIVRFSYAAVLESGCECSCVILNVKPITHVLAISIHWERLTG
jgi:hypothetical protein